MSARRRSSPKTYRNSGRSARSARFSSGGSGGSRPSSVHFHSSAEPLEIVDAQFLSQQTAAQNHTEGLQVKDTDLIIRRGRVLLLKVSTSVQLTCRYIATLIFVPVFRPRERFGQFRAKGIAEKTNAIWLSITFPSSFPVGKYHAHISLAIKGRAEVVTYFHNKAIVVLFNPWDLDDDTYMEDDAQIKSYLLDEVGTIWRGTEDSKTPLLWEYGQYGEHSLDVALFLLRSLSANDCRSAAKVCRCLVSSISSRDNSGVIAASSGGSSIGGTHPCRWTGSAPILDKYYRTKNSVRFGQCWVFAGVAITLFRALGIPSRPVTCYNSAHYCKTPGQVERFFTATGDMVYDIGKDQTWIYHVWCEAWMRRDDLSREYDGWQVLDATPQDKQSGRFRIGPASLLAILEENGKKYPYDVEYVKSDVGANIYYRKVAESYVTMSNQASTLTHIVSSEVGTSLVTASYGEHSHLKPLDVTANYKNRPATPEHDTSSQCFPPPGRDCSFSIRTNQAKLGDDITLTVDVKNNGAMLRNIDGRVVGTIIYYTGQPVRTFMSMEFTGTVSPGQSATVTLPIPAKKYLRNLVEQSMIQFFVSIKVRENKQVFLKLHTLQLQLPELLIQCPSIVTEGNEFRVKISFTNVLSNSLSRILFLVQAQAMCPQKELSRRKLVLPGAVAKVEFSLRAQTPGTFFVLVSMFCDQLSDVRGQAKITVTPMVSIMPPPPPPDSSTSTPVDI